MVSADRPPYFEIIVRTLAPLVGSNMANAVTRGHCEKLGVPTERMSADIAEKVVQAIAPGLRVFVGGEKSEAALDRIRRDVRAWGGPR